MRKSLWSPDEDAKLKQYVTKHGYGNWSDVAKHAGLQRCGKSCRLRWLNYLRPDLKRGKFSADEIRLIVKLHKSLGNSWSKIASFLPGRTDNDIKNFWHSYTRSTRKVDQQPTSDHSTTIHGTTSSINGTTSSITVASNSSALPRCDNYTGETAAQPSPSDQMMQLITATSSNSCTSYSPTTDKITDSPISTCRSTGQMMSIGNCTYSTHNPNFISNVPWELNSSNGLALSQPSMIKLVNRDTSSFDHSRQLEPGLLKMIINCSTSCTPASLIVNAASDPLSSDNPILNMQNMGSYPSAYADQCSLHSFTWDEEPAPAPEGLQSVVWSFMKATTTKEDLSSTQELQAT